MVGMFIRPTLPVTHRHQSKRAVTWFEMTFGIAKRLNRPDHPLPIALERCRPCAGCSRIMIGIGPYTVRPS